MERNVNEALLNNDSCAKALVDLISENEEKFNLTESSLYHNFPLYRNDDDSITVARVMLVSKNYGIVIFQCTDQSERTMTEDDAKRIREELEQMYSVIYAELVKSKLLRARTTRINIQVLPSLFLPNFRGDTSVFQEDWEELTIVRDRSDLQKLFGNNSREIPLDENVIKEAIAILEGSKGIVRLKERPKDTSGYTKGRVLEEIESQIANFDRDQKRAALITLDGPQRIRGLAGSGKTIILTMKAALIHLQHPAAEIYYTFYTRSLYALITQFIIKFYRHFAGREPNWDKLHILHAWGGPNLPGVYYLTCINNDIPPVSYAEVRHYKDPFKEVCQRLNQHKLEANADYLIIDEGQDFPKEFYRLCRQITKNNRVIWGYDECQNIFDISIQDTKETFGRDPDGNYYIDFSKSPSDSLQDRVLRQCYRNPRRVLVSAFAIGLGIYNEPILQMPENNEHWEDLGFKVLEGQSHEGNKMTVTRPFENSPLVKNRLLESEDIVKVQTFDSIDDECEYVASRVSENIKDNLLPEDILIISLDDRHARRYFKVISLKLKEKRVQTFNILDAPYYSKALE